MRLIKLRSGEKWADLELGETRTLAELPECVWHIAREAMPGDALVLTHRGWQLVPGEDD